MPFTPAITWSDPMEGRYAATIGADWNRRYTKTLRAVTNSPRLGPNYVLAHCPIAIGNRYTEGNSEVGVRQDYGSWAQEITAEPEGTGDGLNWLVRVEYGPTEPVSEDPLDRDPKISWEFVAFEEIVDEDEDGEPVVNTAFDYFDPPLTRTERRPVVTVVRNESSFPYSLAADYQDAVNDADFLIVGDSGKWKVEEITSQSARAKTALFGASVEFTYWVTTYKLAYNRKGWTRQILNQGMRQLNAAGDGWDMITIRGQPISSPAMLDDDGRALDPDGTPVFKEFRTYSLKDFSAFNFSGYDFGEGPIP